MIIHFITSSRDIESNIENSRLVVDALHENEHILARDWVEVAYQRALKGSEADKVTWQMIAKENFEAIARADAVIADITVDSTAIGYQIAMAVQQKKPTLLILKQGSVAPPFTWNIPSSFLSRVEYTTDNIKKKITPFLKDNDIPTKDLRFNFFIDRHIYNYLRWASTSSGKTKAEILRELVLKEIDKEDKL